MSNNEIIHSANETSIEKSIELTKMYKLKFITSGSVVRSEFFIIVGCYDQDPEEYIRAYCEVHRYEINKENGPFWIADFECEEATHHDPSLNLLDLSYGHSDEGLAVYDHSNCTIESLNYGWHLEDVLETIQAQQEEEGTLEPFTPQRCTRPTGSIPLTYGDNEDDEYDTQVHLKDGTVFYLDNE